MERDQRRKPSWIPALTHALISLELAAQIFSLSPFPSTGSMAGLGLSTHQAEWRGVHFSAGSASFLLQRFSRTLLAFSVSEDLERADGDSDEVEWIHVEVIFRQKFHSSDLILPLPSTHSSPNFDRDGSPPTLTKQSASRPIPFSRLTC
jgi:hypothetical protein